MSASRVVFALSKKDVRLQTHAVAPLPRSAGFQVRHGSTEVLIGLHSSRTSRTRRLALSAAVAPRSAKIIFSSYIVLFEPACFSSVLLARLLRSGRIGISSQCCARLVYSLIGIDLASLVGLPVPFLFQVSRPGRSPSHSSIRVPLHAATGGRSFSLHCPSFRPGLTGIHGCFASQCSRMY